MKSAATALMLLIGVCATTFAAAQTLEKKPGAVPSPAIQEPLNPTPVVAGPPAPGIADPAPDAQSLASEADVSDARRTYRAQCERYASPGFCECVTAGVAQALMPAEVRIAARTIGERINAPASASVSAQTDAPRPGASTHDRIISVEGHYANTCAQFR